MGKKGGHQGRPGNSLGRVRTIKAESLAQQPGFESKPRPFAACLLSSLYPWLSSPLFLSIKLKNLLKKNHHRRYVSCVIRYCSCTWELPGVAACNCECEWIASPRKTVHGSIMFKKYSFETHAATCVSTTSKCLPLYQNPKPCTHFFPNNRFHTTLFY